MRMTRRLGSLGAVAARRQSRADPAIDDARLRAALARFAALADRILDQPEQWLADPDGRDAGSVRSRLTSATRRAAFGRTGPGTPGWGSLALAQRTRWWTRRIALTAGTAAAAPHVGGVVLDQLPVQDALGASAAGLAVCAVARENGITEPRSWIPLLASVILERDVDAGAVEVPTPDSAEQDLRQPADTSSTSSSTTTTTSPPAGARPSTRRRLSGAGAQAGRSMWRLARTLLELQSLFDERPRGGRLARTVGLLPVVGVVGGWVDERGGIRRAARSTQRLIDVAAPTSPGPDARRDS